MTYTYRAARLLAGGLLAAFFVTTPALAAEPILGTWKTASGETAVIAPCGGAFCITLKTGKHAGKRIGELSGSAPRYAGEITDPANDKTYSGSAALSGDQLKLRGCDLKVLCRSQSWSRL